MSIVAVSNLRIFSAFFYNLDIGITHFPLFRHLQTKTKDNAPDRKVDRLVLHQSSPSPSLSSLSPSEQDIRLQIKTEGVGICVGLQRPETSRGRLVRTYNTHLDDAESPLQNQESSLEEEASWIGRKDRKKKEEEVEERKRKRAEREERSLQERKEEREGERRKVDREVEEEREHLMREKERRMHLLQEELRREEEEEERKLKEESEERVR